MGWNYTLPLTYRAGEVSLVQEVSIRPDQGPETSQHPGLDLD